jgi:hypothetical protein
MTALSVCGGPQDVLAIERQVISREVSLLQVPFAIEVLEIDDMPIRELEERVKAGGIRRSSLLPSEHGRGRCYRILYQKQLARYRAYYSAGTRFTVGGSLSIPIKPPILRAWGQQICDEF